MAFSIFRPGSVLIGSSFPCILIILLEQIYTVWPRSSPLLLAKLCCWPWVVDTVCKHPLLPLFSSLAAFHRPPSCTKAAGYSKKQETASPTPSSGTVLPLKQQFGTSIVTAAPTRADTHVQDDGRVTSAGPTSTTET